jgi:hypothetical protein
MHEDMEENENAEITPRMSGPFGHCVPYTEAADADERDRQFPFER